MYGYGCISKILQLLKLPDGTVKVLVEGEKVKILNIEKSQSDFLVCEYETVEDQNKSKELDTYALGIIKKFEKLTVLTKKETPEFLSNIKGLKDASQIANNISANLKHSTF